MSVTNLSRVIPKFFRVHLLRARVEISMWKVMTNWWTHYQCPSCSWSRDLLLFYIKHPQHLAASNLTSSICSLSSFCNQEQIYIIYPRYTQLYNISYKKNNCLENIYINSESHYGKEIWSNFKNHSTTGEPF